MMLLSPKKEIKLGRHSKPSIQILHLGQFHCPSWNSEIGIEGCMGRRQWEWPVMMLAIASTDLQAHSCLAPSHPYGQVGLLNATQLEDRVISTMFTFLHEA
jgi:hypothetical protein